MQDCDISTLPSSTAMTTTTNIALGDLREKGADSSPPVRLELRSP